MSILLETVKKRDGTIVVFDENKIVAAVSRAFNAPIPKKVLKRINHLLEVADMGNNVDIEKIQDIVEMALVKEGYFQVAKDYILYRDEKAKLREQKMKLLEVDSLSEVEKRYSYNALRIFKERYLLKDNNGQIVERLDDLFKRVAVASGIMEVLYDEQWYHKEGKDGTFVDGHDRVMVNDRYLDDMKTTLQHFQESLVDLDYKNILNDDINIKIGDFIVNPFHQERLMARFVELYEEGKLPTTYYKIINYLENNPQKYLPKIQKYYDLMAHKFFLPNTPMLMNAGTKLGQGAACFVIGVDDSIEGIADMYKDLMVISKSGGGVGCNWSNLRPQGAIIKSTGGVSSGVLSFMKIVDDITDVVKQGGKRKGANMGLLNSSHPEILKFIKIKNNESKKFENFNISLAVDDHFIECFFLDKDYNLTFDGKLYSTINAKRMMNMINENVHECADPGMVFLENMNKNNLLKEVYGPIMSCNPCQEENLYEGESCNLASINLAKFIKEDKFDVNHFMEVCSIVTQFLDGVIDSNKYPTENINKVSKDCRRIGLGYMLLGEALTQLGIPYNSKEGFTFIEYVTAIMTGASLYTSAHMSNIKGSFPLYYYTEYEKNRGKMPVNGVIFPKIMEDLERRIDLIKPYLTENSLTDVREYYDSIPVEDMGLRNCNTTMIAPTGTLSMFVDGTHSSGIEPIFSHGFTKKVTIGEFDYVNPTLEQALRKEGLYSDEMLKRIVKQNNGTLGNIPEIPKELKDVFITAMEMHPFDHITAQASAQKWITNSISKTINTPIDITPKDVEYCYLLSWAMGTKGISLYRDGSKSEQVLNNNNTKATNKRVKASLFTTDWIKSLDNIPDKYKNELLKACNPDNLYGFYSYDNIVIPNLLIDKTIGNPTTNIYCPSCGASNSLQPNGAHGCQLCKACGHGIGSC